MDKNKFSNIGYANHEFYNPISKAKIERVLNLLDLDESSSVIDIGSGKCEILIRLIEKYNIVGTGIELYEGFIKEAETYFNNNQDVQYDMGICIGSTHALCNLENTLKQLNKTVKTGGYILIGESYWKSEPPTEYLDALGIDESGLNTHYGNIQKAEELGLVSLWSSVASDDDWDEYEGLYAMSIENYCYKNIEDEDVGEMLEKIRVWKHIYLSMGRDILVFGLYLFRNC